MEGGCWPIVDGAAIISVEGCQDLDVIDHFLLTFSEQPPSERSVGVGKKHLLEWCQKELSTEFDSRNTLTHK